MLTHERREETTKNLADPKAPFDIVGMLEDILMAPYKRRCPHCVDGITTKVVSASDKPGSYAHVEPVRCPHCGGNHE